MQEMGIVEVLMISGIELFSLLNNFYSFKSFQFYRTEINHQNWIVIGPTIANLPNSPC